MAGRRILVLGGYGLIGMSVVRRLIEDGFDVVGMGRDREAGNRTEPRAQWLEADMSSLLEPEAWMPFINGMHGVVNASGALQTGMRDNLEKLQNRSVVALVEACEKSGLSTFVQISAPGASSGAELEFLRTKGIADERLARSSLGWVILRPGLVVSPAAYGGTALLRMLASFPAVVPLAYSEAPVATVDVSEVAEAVSLSLRGDIPPGSDLDLLEKSPSPLRAVVLAFRSWLGLPRPAAVVSLPGWAARACGMAADLLGLMGWRSPMRSTAMEVMSGGVVGDPEGYRRIVGRYPASLEATLRKYPATVQERWFAVLYMAMPVIVAVLALFWIVSGLVGLAALDVAAGHLTSAGLGRFAARTAVISGSAADVALGLCALFRPTSRAALIGMAAVTAGYLAAGSLFAPELWMDPLGPYLKTVPGAVLALVAAMLSRSR